MKWLAEKGSPSSKYILCKLLLKILQESKKWKKGMNKKLKSWNLTAFQSSIEINQHSFFF